MNNKPVFRNPELYQQLPLRDYIREKCPTPSQGLSVLDLDLVPLMFGGLVNRHRNDDGKFMLIEVKNKSVKINYAQKRLLQLMHRLFREADKNRNHYIGAYLLHWDHDNNKPVAVNNNPIDEATYIKWMSNEIELPSLFDDEC